MFNGVRGIYYRELMVLKNKWIKTILASSISPMLFLIAFGYGLGRYTSVNNINYMAFLIPWAHCNEQYESKLWNFHRDQYLTILS